MIPQYSAKVLDIQNIARNTKKFVFSKPENWNYKPGQFISIKFTERAFRAYSIASHPDEKYIELVVRLIEGGLGSTVLNTTKIGDCFMFRGAFGHFGLKPEYNSSLIFCATGTGIAPFRSMILEETKQKKPRPMYLLYGGRNASDIAYLNEIRNWSDTVNVHVAFSREQNPDTLKIWEKKLDATVINGRITDYLDPKNPQYILTDKNMKHSAFYLCGNGDMVMSIRTMLLDQNISPSQVMQERFN